MTTPPSTVLIRLHDGATVAVCGPPCAGRWQLMYPLDSAPAEMDPADGAPPDDCSQCGWCGTTCAVPTTQCIRHGEDCPRADFMASESARAAHLLITARSGPMTELGWQLLTAASLARAERTQPGRPDAWSTPSIVAEVVAGMSAG